MSIANGSPYQHLAILRKGVAVEWTKVWDHPGIAKTPGRMPEGDAGLGPPSRVERRLVKLFPGRRSRGTGLPPGPSTQTRMDTARAVFGKIVRFKHPLEGSGE